MYIIDRFEDEFAILEDDNCENINVLRSFLPENAKESDCLDLIDGKYCINIAETEKHRQYINEILARLSK